MTDQPTRRSRRTTLRAIPVAVLGLLIAVLAPAPAAVAQPGTACENRANVTYSMLLECMTLEGVREHQAAFQAIADANDDPFYPGTRAAGTEGYANSVDYVAGLLKDAGYEVTLDPVDITFNFPAVLRQLTPVVAEYESGVFTGSGSGTVEGHDPRRHQPHAPRASTSGCEAADFAGIDWSGDADIALVQRGTCFFGDKAHNAELAGAEAVIIFNQGNTPDREGLIVADATSITSPTARRGRSRTTSPWWERASPMASPCRSRARPRSSRCCPPRSARTTTSLPSCQVRTRTTS